MHSKGAEFSFSASEVITDLCLLRVSVAMNEPGRGISSRRRTSKGCEAAIRESEGDADEVTSGSWSLVRQPSRRRTRRDSKTVIPESEGDGDEATAGSCSLAPLPLCG